jgi:hypothetical protein
MSSQKKGATLSRQQFLMTMGATLGLVTTGVLYKTWWKSSHPHRIKYHARAGVDASGYGLVWASLRHWPENASLPQIRDAFIDAQARVLASAEERLGHADLPDFRRIQMLFAKASILDYQGKPQAAYDVLVHARSVAMASLDLQIKWLYSILYFQGVTALRRGETENCVMCLGQGSCILPIAPAAVHKKQDGSRLAVKHFMEYLQQFPDDIEVQWLLNLAYMTLGEYPRQVAPSYRISLDRYLKSEFDIGAFHDVAAPLGLNRLNLAGGAIMEDFDNDGNLDIVTTSFDTSQSMAYYHNRGDGTFEDRTEAAGLLGQLGGLNCVQTDYNNDGLMDIFVTRGAWFKIPMHPTLLRNNGDGTFTDVTEEAGLMAAVTSNAAQWADYDNDGFLDLFICCEAQPNKLYHNNGDGTFTEVAEKAGVAGKGKISSSGGFYKGCTWIDIDNNGYPDLFLNNLSGRAELYRNKGDGTFTEITMEQGIDGPEMGFSCWAFDYDNDGYLDIFATSYDKSVEGVVKGLLGQPHACHSNCLFHNQGGTGFVNVTKEAGLDMVFATMGSNFGDFDNDGYLDFYLGTGDPELTTLVPNRMFKNVSGKRFAEITASAGVGNLQKGHGVACGDWDNDGNVDIFIELGGSVPGDAFRNAMYQNPGNGNHFLTVKLIGKKTNRAAIGARIKVVTVGDAPMTIHRHVSSGSSFGGNPLQQTIGLAKAQKVATLEIHWPTSKTTQVFHDIAINQFIEITEFEEHYRKVERKRIPVGRV